MTHPFDPIIINGMALANRFVRSATWEGLATDDGMVTDRLIELYRNLAEGEVGLIISSHCYVAPSGKATPWQVGIYSEKLLPGLTRLVRTVHEAGGKIVCQLAHAGLFGRPDIPGEVPFAPSAVSGFTGTLPRAMTPDDINGTIIHFGDAAALARSAGFDGIQIHAAHGYLLSQFLSPAFNQRQDDYGDSVENRARLAIEIVKEVRDRVGPGYPVLVKMNCRDYLPGGLELDEALQIADMLRTAGVDAIEVSGGTLVSGKQSPSRTTIRKTDDEAYFEEAARAFKESLDIPIILVGGIRSFAVADRIISEPAADCVSMSRPLIREPDLVKRWKSGDHTRAACLSDNRCFEPAMAGRGVCCIVEQNS